MPVGDGPMRCINDGVAGTAMLMASRRRLDVTTINMLWFISTRDVSKLTCSPLAASVSERLHDPGRVHIRCVAGYFVRAT